MTEYDYSPGASERYQEKLRNIGNWAKETSSHSSEFSYEASALTHSQYAQSMRSQTPSAAPRGVYSSSSMHPANAPPPTSYTGSRARSPRPSPRSGLAPLPPMLGTPTITPGMSLSQVGAPQQPPPPPQPLWLTVPQQPAQQPQYAVSPAPFMPSSAQHAGSYVAHPPPPPQSYVTVTQAPPIQMPIPYHPQQYPPPSVIYPAQAPPSIQQSMSGQTIGSPSMTTIVIQDERRGHRSGHRSRSPSRSRRKHKNDTKSKKSRSPTGSTNTYIITQPQAQAAQQHQTPYIVLPRHGDPKVYYV